MSSLRKLTPVATPLRRHHPTPACICQGEHGGADRHSIFPRRRSSRLSAYGFFGRPSCLETIEAKPGGGLPNCAWCSTDYALGPLRSIRMGPIRTARASHESIAGGPNHGPASPTGRMRNALSRARTRLGPHTDHVLVHPKVDRAFELMPRSVSPAGEHGRDPMNKRVIVPNRLALATSCQTRGGGELNRNRSRRVQCSRSHDSRPRRMRRTSVPGVQAGIRRRPCRPRSHRYFGSGYSREGVILPGASPSGTPSSSASSSRTLPSLPPRSPGASAISSPSSTDRFPHEHGCLNLREIHQTEVRSHWFSLSLTLMDADSRPGLNDGTVPQNQPIASNAHGSGRQQPLQAGAAPGH